jgi:hypothetical protein
MRTELLDGRGRDRLVDAIVAWGDESDVARRVREHLDGGADHVFCSRWEISRSFFANSRASRQCVSALISLSVMAVVAE